MTQQTGNESGTKTGENPAPDAEPNRRPISVRSAPWAQAIARSLTSLGVTPNQISIASVGFAALGGGLLWLSSSAETGRGVLYVLSILAIYGRLLCNMFDGLVAVEGGKGSAAGELFNEVPDRVADVFFLIGAGAATGAAHGVGIGIVAAFAAVLTAYVRALGASQGLPQDFGGPMAKPHRMHCLAGLLALAALTSGFGIDKTVLLIGLTAIAAITGLTVWLRLARAYRLLMARSARPQRLP